MSFENAKKLAFAGHSLLITGQCGTGKTSLMRSIIDELHRTKVVAITATTGMASVALGHGAMTIHHWAGLGDGRLDAVELAPLFLNDERYQACKTRIVSAKTITIDEIGMLSMRVFDALEYVCRKVRGNDCIFGGLQVIASGDFKQLAPVPNHWVGDDGSHCFNSQYFRAAFPHIVHLEKILRQEEPDLVKAVHELCDGTPSPETEELLRSLDRPLAGTPVHLYGTNFDAEFENLESLDQFQGELYSFAGKDTGNTRLLRTCPVNKILGLKVGAPVILVRNLSKTLFNGMKGTVYGFGVGKSSMPTFNFGGQLISLPPERFDVFDKTSGKVLACRMQIPVKLAFALTTHRSQGQTLPLVDVDCQSFFAAGQLGVAIGRAVNKEGLRVRHYNPIAARIKHPESVYEFYNNDSVAEQADLSCCRSVCNADDTLGTGHSHQVLPSTSKIPDILPESIQECPFDFREFLTNERNTTYMASINKDIFESNRMADHVRHLHAIIRTLYQEPQKTQEFANLYIRFNTFLLSSEHADLCQQLFDTPTLQPHQTKFSTKTAFWILHKVIEEAAGKVVETQAAGQLEGSEGRPSDVGLAKIRYIAGGTIFKVGEQLRLSVTAKLGRTITKKSRLSVKMDYQKRQLLKALRISEEEALAVEGPSMSEILHKQQTSHGLFIVSDKVLDFFVLLNDRISRLLSPDRIHMSIDTLHDSCRSVQGDQTLINNWCSLFPSVTESCEEVELDLTNSLLIDLFMAASEHFIRVSISDSIKTFKDTLPKTKKQALRAKLQAVGDRKSKAQPELEEKEIGEYVCKICERECEDEFDDPAENSIACDFCNRWFHYRCCGVKGTESFLKTAKATWKCTFCKTSGKKSSSGRGKKSRRS